MLRTLVLTAKYSPISVFPINNTVISWQAAVGRIFAGTCNVVSEYEEYIEHPNVKMFKPAVIVRKQYDGEDLARTQENSHVFDEGLYYRDSCRCQYCERPISIQEMTIEHVIPQSKGGLTVWSNVVAACSSCNNQKGNSMPIGMWKPKKAPWTPNYHKLVNMRKNYPLIIDHESWIPFFNPWPGGLIIKGKNEKNNINIIN